MGGEILIMSLNEENLKEEVTERRDDESGPDYLLAVGEAQPVAFLCWARSLALIRGNYWREQV